MSNQFALKPKLEEGFPNFDDTWICPITGMKVPKDPDKNLAWRVKLLEMAEDDPDFQDALYTACSQSLLFFVNAFVFTLRVFEPGEGGKTKQAKNKHLPMVTWPIQDTHMLWIEHKIDNGEEGLSDKSRDMGATWNHIAVYAHRFIWRKSESHLLLSRKEDTVDLLDGLPKGYPHGPIADPGTLFGKIDYILSYLPDWMLPNMGRKKMHLVNLDTSTRIDGESANATAGSSDRRTSIFMDEMAKMKEAESIKRSTADVTACRLPCSTPNGAGTAYSKWRLSGQIDVFILPWWEHPEKGQNRYVAEDELGRFKIRSPWYDAEEEKRSPKEMAIEIDMDHVGSGDTFFEGIIVEEHKKLFATRPIRTLGINFKKNIADADLAVFITKADRTALKVTGNGKVKIWGNLIQGRLDQSKTYVMGVDISKGQGASNSTISGMCVETREKVLEFADANTPPYELARIACAVGVWMGGRGKLPLLCWENNGDPGFDFGRQVVRIYQYPKIFFDRVAGTIAEKAGKRYGWRSTREKKAAALGLLRRAYAHGGYINHSEEALDEALTYIHYDNGGIGPAEFVEESDAARQTHGDRVIADMLCVVAADTTPVSKHKNQSKAPGRTFGSRFEAFKRRKKAARKGSRDRFDWRAA